MIQGAMIYFSEYRMIRGRLSDEQKGKLLDALMHYAETDEPLQTEDPILGISFDLLADGVRRSREAYQRKSEANARNAGKRWHASACDGMRAQPTVTVTEAVPVTVTETERGKGDAPTPEEVREYCQAEGLKHTNPAAFYDHFSATGWTTAAGQPLKDWRARLRSWDREEEKKTRNRTGKRVAEQGYTQRDYSDEELESLLAEI